MVQHPKAKSLAGPIKWKADGISLLMKYSNVRINTKNMGKTVKQYSCLKILQADGGFQRRN